MKIRTRFFTIRARKGFLFIRIGSAEYGIEGKIAHMGSYARLNWGVASWTLAQAGVRKKIKKV